MIKEFVEKFDNKRDELKEAFREKHPESYEEIVKKVVGLLTEKDSYDLPDPARIHSIDDGHYQGTLLFVIGATDYQPNTYWYVKVGYGSCSGCDTLESIRGYEDGKPSEQEVADYMTLALHILQGLKEMK